MTNKPAIVYPEGLSPECRMAWEEVCDLDREGVKREFRKDFADEEQRLIRRAVLVLRAEQLGIKPEDLRIPVANWLLMVTSGKITATLVARYLGRDRLLKYLAMLRPEVQKKLMEEPMVRVAEETPDGQIDYRVKALDELKSSEMDQVFGIGVLNSDTQQIKKLREQKQEPKPRRSKRGLIKANPARDILIINGVEFAADLVAEKLADLGWVCRRKRQRVAFGRN